MNKNHFFLGARDALPIVLGYFPLAMTFGVLARSSNLSLGQIVAMSLMIYSGSAQFIAVSMLGSGATPPGIIATILLVNSRLILLSASLAPYLPRMAAPVLSFLAHGLTDETYALAVSRTGETPPTRWYLSGLFITSHLAWVGGSALGGFMGALLGDTSRWGFDFALTAMFICLLIMQLKNNITIAVACLAGLISITAATMLGRGWNIIPATVLAATIGVLMEKWNKPSG
ncbi:AzlC family ABC transporter permease [Desulfofundulus thermocisternus]|uniref:AzlC family ABC transporter permease n=1 Tax=Desulfofundulus thermocisternus TaxID=42471 RepID=UPI0019EE1D85|nr:AzlC family ABC transporter permease [Desulfofundulus thermocisternus]MBE3586288.1 AzlC family ABC transporter permease [Thermoanaerobacter sp.]MCS5695772.1 AzlC family ABC transporter permease [Desulfofundulus thermocisternus]